MVKKDNWMAQLFLKGQAEPLVLLEDLSKEAAETFHQEFKKELENFKPFVELIDDKLGHTVLITKANINCMMVIEK